MELNGWLTLTQNITDKTKRTKNNERLTTVWENGGFSAKLSIRNLIRYKPFPGDQIQSSEVAEARRERHLLLVVEVQKATITKDQKEGKLFRQIHQN